MNRDNVSSMVGNDDFVIGSTNVVRKQRPSEPRRKFAFPDYTRDRSTPVIQERFQTPVQAPAIEEPYQATVVHEEFQAPVVEEQYQEPSIDQQYQYHAPIQDLNSLVYNAPLENRGFSLPSLTNYTSGLFTKTKVVYITAALAVIGLTSLTLINLRQVESLTRDVKSYAVALVDHGNNHQVATPVNNPEQIIIHSSDYDNAMTALMTQTITINAGGTSQIVNGSEIANWLNLKSKGSLDYISVNQEQVTSYLNQVARNNNMASYSQAVLNQITNNLLKAKGITVTL